MQNDEGKEFCATWWWGLRADELIEEHSHISRLNTTMPDTSFHLKSEQRSNPVKCTQSLPDLEFGTEDHNPALYVAIVSSVSAA